MTRRTLKVVAVDGGYQAVCVAERPGEPPRAVVIPGAPVCDERKAAQEWLYAWILRNDPQPAGAA